MYTTKEAIELLMKKPLGLTLMLKHNNNIHIFKTVDDEIYIGEYGNGQVYDFNRYKYKYLFNKWVIDFRGSKNLNKV